MAQRADGLNDIFEHNVTVRENLDAKGGTVRDTPTIPKDIVNKEYVDKNIVANVFLFFTENASDIATYYDTQPSPSADAEENIITAIPGNSTGTLMASYATPDGCDCVSGFVELPLGLYSFHVHGLASSANSLRMFGEVYHRTAGGTETLLLTSDDSNLISITKGGIDFHGQLTTPKTWSSTDRLVFKIYAKNESAAARDMTIYTEGTTASRCELPAVRATPPTVDYKSGCRASLTGNQTIPTVSWTKLQFGTEEYDIQGEFDNVTNYRFTATRVGYYQVNLNVYSNPLGNEVRFLVGIYKNGGAVSEAETSSSGAGADDYESKSVSDIIYLAVGDYIEGYVYQNSGVIKDMLSGTSKTYMSIMKIA